MTMRRRHQPAPDALPPGVARITPPLGVRLRTAVDRKKLTLAQACRAVGLDAVTFAGMMLGVQAIDPVAGVILEVVLDDAESRPGRGREGSRPAHQ